DGVLFVLVNDLPYHFQDDEYIGEGKYPDSRVSRFPRMDRNWGGVQASSWLESKRAIKAFDAKTGRALWQRKGNVIPLTLAADSERTYQYDGENILALDRANGKVLWSSNEVPTWSAMQSWFAPTLVVHDGKVLFAGGENIKLTYMGYPEGSGEDTMFAFSAETGKQLWKADHPNGGYNSPEDLLIADSRVWTGSTGDSKSDGILKGHDLGSGRITKELPPTVETKWFHHRCYRAKGTENYLLMSRTGIEFLDLQTKEWTPNHWVRGGCLYGVMPANGLIYTPPHDCPCYIEAKQYGFNALAPTSESRRAIPVLTNSERLEKGPAYNKISNIKYQIEMSGRRIAATVYAAAIRRQWFLSPFGVCGNVGSAIRLPVRSMRMAKYSLPNATGMYCTPLTKIAEGPRGNIPPAGGSIRRRLYIRAVFCSVVRMGMSTACVRGTVSLCGGFLRRRLTGGRWLSSNSNRSGRCLAACL
ncbi:MAG: PQQ-binding-like beta-propeller repeat protein, partial [Planctomycetes bacterium]|nr:PQQ-binding-like beta-propeller repeat protein [Planctomycetota bacterium]